MKLNIENVLERISNLISKDSEDKRLDKEYETWKDKKDMLWDKKKNDWTNPNAKRVLYLMNSGDGATLIPNFFITNGEQKWLMRTIFNVMKKFPRYKLIIKGRASYSNTDSNYIPNMVAKEMGFTNFEFVRETSNPSRFLEDADLVLFQNTGMVLKAMIMEIPVICLEFKHMLWNSSFVDKAITMVFNEKDLLKEMDKVLWRRK